MELTARVRTARRPLLTAMAIALAAAVLSLLPIGSEAAAQNRGNVQAEQSDRLRERRPSSPTLPPVGRYVAESGEGFILHRAGRPPRSRGPGRA